MINGVIKKIFLSLRDASDLVAIMGVLSAYYIRSWLLWM